MARFSGWFSEEGDEEESYRTSPTNRATCRWCYQQSSPQPPKISTIWNFREAGKPAPVSRTIPLLTKNCTWTWKINTNKELYVCTPAATLTEMEAEPRWIQHPQRFSHCQIMFSSQVAAVRPASLKCILYHIINMFYSYWEHMWGPGVHHNLTAWTTSKYRIC